MSGQQIHTNFSYDYVRFDRADLTKVGCDESLIKQHWWLDRVEQVNEATENLSKHLAQQNQQLDDIQNNHDGNNTNCSQSLVSDFMFYLRRFFFINCENSIK